MLLCLGLVSGQSLRSSKLQMRECADGIAAHHSAVVEDFLEFDGRFSALVRCQMGLAAHIDGVQRPE